MVAGVQEVGPGGAVTPLGPAPRSKPSVRREFSCLVAWRYVGGAATRADALGAPTEGSRPMPQTNKPATESSAGQSTTSPEPAPSERRQPEPRKGSTMWAAIEVLRGKRKPMTAADIYAEIRERNLAPNLSLASAG